MRYHSLLAPTVLLLSTSLLAQTPGETPTPPTPAGEAPPVTLVGAQNLTGTVPAAYRTVFGNTNNNIPISWSPERYQQVFLGSELPTKLAVFGLGFRFDQAFSNFKGQTVDLEITLAYTKKTPANLSSTFASNFDITTPKPVVVFPRKKFTLPNMPATKPTNPQLWQIQIPFKVPFIWTQVKGRNMLVQIRIYGNSNSNRFFTYPLDAASGTKATTTRLFGTGPTATTGSLGRNYGLVMSFLDKIKTTATYSSFGTGCPGTGGTPGVVLPTAMTTKVGNSNNYYGVGRANMRYQQVFTGSQVGTVRRFVGHSLRARARTDSGGSQTLEIKVSSTTYSPSTITGTFNTNITSKQTIVFKKKTYNYPTMTLNTNPSKFQIRFKWDNPYLWLKPKGQNLLIEVINTSSKNLLYFPDAISGDSNVTRIYATSGSTATTGTIGRNYGVVMRFDYVGLGSAIPAISSTGTPILGKTFSIDLDAAKANTAAGLIVGLSKSLWGQTKLPLDLTPLNAKGCNLLVSPDLITGVGVGATGSAKVQVPIPNQKSLIGVQWHNQFLVLDAKANGLGMAFSNGGSAKVGEQ